MSRVVRTVLAGSVLLIGAVAFVVSLEGQSGSGGVLSQLRVPEEAAHRSFVNLVWTGAGVPPGAVVFKAASPQQRAAIVKGLGVVMAAYSRTDDFKRRYAEAREAKQPKPPEAPKTAEQLRAEQMAEFDKGIAELRTNAGTATQPEMKKQLEQMVAAMTAQKAAMDKPAMWTQLAAQTKVAHEVKLERHRASMKQFDADWPADSNVLLARRLKEFLELSTTVDFNAKLVQGKSGSRFADPALEQKPPMWKLCYRAGKEAVDAARDVATAWLKELQSRQS